MRYLYIRDIRELFLFSIFSSIIYMAVSYLSIFVSFISDSTQLFHILWIFEEFYLNFFVYPIILLSFFYIYQRLYKVEIDFRTKVYLFYLFMVFSFFLKAFLYIKLDSQTILVYSLESFAIFSLIIDVTLQELSKGGKLVSRILFLVSLFPIIRFFSLLSNSLSFTFNIFFFLFFLPTYTYVNYEMVFFYKSKRTMFPNVMLLFLSLLFMFISEIFGIKTTTFLSFLFFLGSVALVLSNTRLYESLISDKPYKKSIPIIYLFSSISLLSVISLHPEFYMVSFSMTFVVILQLFFYSLLFDIFPSINFSLYPTEGVRSSIFWYYLINGLFLSVSIFTGKLLYETLLAVYTLSLILNILIFKEVIFLSSTL